MSEDPAEKPALTPAEDNPWYRLMTVHGVQDGERIDEKLHALNRQTWNRWATSQLDDAAKQKLFESGFEWEDLTELTAEDQAAVSGRFAGMSVPHKIFIDMRRTEVPLHLVCRKFYFPGYADFSDASFSGYADFSDASFSENADFSDASFSGYADFSDASFSGDAYFSDASFSENADFSDASFSGRAFFVDAKFESLLSFKSVRFLPNSGSRTVCPFAFFGAKLHESVDFIDVTWPPPPNDRDTAIEYRRRYERLKLLMDDQKKFADEHFFLQKELECREVEEGFPRNIPSRLFGWVAGYGWSYTRPLGFLVASTYLGALGFRIGGLEPGAAVALSASNQVGFLGFHRYLLKPAMDQAVAAGLEGLVAGQTVLGALFLFFFFLALRNRFRIK